ncbi:conserved exported hypothetical protein [Flavobacterium psychrophilum]|uniref:hypothetical protein n=1 Tax=Flavobacterium psychrophilum TaxID=96345 RepID=UPI000B7C37CB|nr:hypothetical protein [Flavobacterium psychrophilum]SNB23888.1 conserved exported hypothetical protein [Flavobacterium psychrophilum]
MKTILNTLGLLFFAALLFISCGQKEAAITKKPINYTVVLDLSDRILHPNQLDNDFELVTTYFKDFEQKARRNLVLTSKDCFTVKIIPQKNSPLPLNQYEDVLQIHLNEIDCKDKNKSLANFSKSLAGRLHSLKKDALYSTNSNDYFGVDIWSYLHDYGKTISKVGYENKILMLTDGYFDFENQAHVLQKENRYTSTQFLDTLNSTEWKTKAISDNYGLLPITLDKNSKWIVAGISSKKSNDILQMDKLIFFWGKWLKESGSLSAHLILNSSKSNMESSLRELL